MVNARYNRYAFNCHVQVSGLHQFVMKSKLYSPPQVLPRMKKIEDLAA